MVDLGFVEWIRLVSWAPAAMTLFSVATGVVSVIIPTVSTIKAWTWPRTPPPPPLQSMELESSLRQWKQPPRGPQKTDWAHAAMSLIGSLFILYILWCLWSIARYDFQHHYSTAISELQTRRAEAKEVYPVRCIGQYPADICKTWNEERTHEWTDQTIEARAFHEAWNHIKEHAIDAWAAVTESWTIRIFLAALLFNIIWYGPVRAVRDAWTMAALKSAADAVILTQQQNQRKQHFLADELQAIPTTTTTSPSDDTWNSAKTLTHL